jgi:hypothetical protein
VCNVKHVLAPLALGLALAASGCAGLSEPSQPTPAGIAATLTQLQAITADPLTAWQAGDYAVRTSCHAFLNASAERDANLGLGIGALGLSGAAAATASPIASGAIALAGSLLTLFQQSGAIPYTAATSSIIEKALDAYEAGVAAGPPQTLEQAASYVDDLWFLCSPGGYAELMQKAAIGAAVSAGSVRAAVMLPRAAAAPPTRPMIQVNGL